jgi:predicted TPR repeat methyltransferase
MTPSPPSRDPAHFEALYADNPDPWDFATSPYEQAKYRATIASLAGKHFSRGVEIGCSIGVLTAMLAPHCDELIGIDPIETALAQARTRCATLPHVSFARMHVPHQFPPGPFDLMVFSEILYFLAEPDLARVATLATTTIQPGGTILLVNYTGRPNDPASGDPLTGHQAANLFITQTHPTLTPTNHHQTPTYRLDRLDRSR